MTRSKSRTAGFTLVEMAMVLVIIGVVMSAVMVGNDVLRHAKGQKSFSVFISGWHEAFTQFTRVTRSLPGDKDPPNNQVGGALDTFRCTEDLTNDMLDAGIRIPPGAGVGEATLYRYQDSSGSLQTLDVCFATINWSVQTSATGFQGKERHVMRIRGLTVELAMQMDVLVDGSLSARFGQFRLQGWHGSTGTGDPGWGTPTTNDGAQPLVTAYFEMF